MSERSGDARTIPGMFRGAVDDVPDKPWLHSEAGELTYCEAQERIERAASTLRAQKASARVTASW